jgi:ABC-2 type transport system permease protein
MFIAGVRGTCLRELAYLRAHPWDLAMVSWFPALIMALTWTIFSQGVNVKLPLALVDEDRSPGSRQLAIALEAERATTIAARPGNLEEAWPLVRERRVYAVLHVPADWERRSRRGDPLPVVLYTNEQFHSAVGSISADVSNAVSAVGGDKAVRALAGLGGGFTGAERRYGAVRVERRSLYAPASSNERLLAAIYMPGILHLFALVGAAYAVGREFRDRTAAAWLASADGCIAAALAGKLLPLIVSFTAMALCLVAWLAGYRGWTANGSVLAWCLSLGMLIVACCAVPALVIGLTGNLRATLGVLAIVNATAVSYTGVTYPLYSMTTGAKVWSAVVPFHYFFEIQHQQWTIGAPLAVSAEPFAVLCVAFIVVPLAIGLPKLAQLCRRPDAWGGR